MLNNNLGIYVGLHVPVIGDICWMATWVYMLDYMYIYWVYMLDNNLNIYVGAHALTIGYMCWITNWVHILENTCLLLDV